MNFFAPTGRNVQEEEEEEELTFREMAGHAYEFIGIIYEMFISVPLLILDKLGFNLIPSLFTSNGPLCSVCICGALIGVACSAGIGLGVGLGVGLACAKSDNITNATILNNSTNGSVITSTISSNTTIASFGTTSLVG